MESRKKMNTPSDTVLWLSHPTRLFRQPEKRKKNKKHVIPIDGLKQNENSNKNSPQTSTGPHTIEDVVTNNGNHMFKDEKFATKCGAKPKKGARNKMEKTTESRGSQIAGNSDQNKSVQVTETKKYENVIRCLDFIQSVAVKCKTEDAVFCNIYKKIQDLEKTEDSTAKTLKYDLINNLLSLLLDSTDDDLKLIGDILEAMTIPDTLKKFVVDGSCIRQSGTLGEGITSVVRSAVLSKDGACTKVAVKIPHLNIFDGLIIHEAKILSRLDHTNIIKILAFKKNGPPGIVLELMELGNLNQALMRAQFSERDILTALLDIAKGMEYLHGKQYLHRDLSCRNIFVSETKKCKIGDLGLSVYVGDSNGIYRDETGGVNKDNVSPETFATRIYRSQTDVWSMGQLVLTLYQLAFSGEVHGCHFQVMAVRDRFTRGLQMKKPARCPADLFQFTTDHLLNMHFESRPNFSVIREKMESYLAN